MQIKEPFSCMSEIGEAVNVQICLVLVVSLHQIVEQRGRNIGVDSFLQGNSQHSLLVSAANCGRPTFETAGFEGAEFA